MGELYRTQVLLERSQHESLQQLAAVEGRSMSEIIREAVAQYLVEQNDQTELQRELNALDQLVALREKIEARYGIYPGDLVSEARVEREQEIEEVLLGKS